MRSYLRGINVRISDVPDTTAVGLTWGGFVIININLAKEGRITSMVSLIQHLGWVGLWAGL